MIYPTRKVRAILRREYLHRVKNKWFVIITFGFPLLFIGIGALPAWLASTPDSDESLRVGVIDRIGVAEGTAEARMTEILRREGAPIELRPASVEPEATREELAASLRASDLDAYLLLTPGLRTGEGTTLLARTSVGQSQRRALRNAARELAVQEELRRAGVAETDLESFFRTASADLAVVRVGEEGEQSQEVLALVALALIFVLYMMFLVYGQMIVRGVLEEKTSDIVEILVSSVRPWELMLGKILGIGAVGLTQIAIWGITAAGVAFYGVAMTGPLLGEIGTGLASISFPVVPVVSAFLVFYLLGYLLYASGFAAVGAMVGDEQETQMVSFPLMMLIMVPFLLALPALENPGADWVLGASLFPFFAPILMVVRITMGAAALWEIALSLALLVLTTAGMAWIAGRIYRVGILMKGKRPDVPELIRWMRHG